MDGQDLVADPDINAEALEKALRGLQSKAAFLADDAADVIGQAAVGIGHETAALQDENLRRLVQTAEPRRGRGASRYAADDQNFHSVLLLA